MTGGCCGNTDAGCGCGSDCGCGSGFVRVRYFFGQRIGVTEMTDALAYSRAKQRFANRMLHGSGVLCGMRVTRVPPDDANAVVLQVSAGAALDDCGREIVVGGDQCLNVAAWFAANRDTVPYRDWGLGTHPVWVAVRYRECPTDPQQAPRNPCSCDTGGCEFARVVEGFEIAPFADITAIAGPPPFPDLSGVRPPLGPALSAALLGPCPPVQCDSGLILAKCDVTIGAKDGVTVVTGLGVPANDVPERTALLSTRTLQTMVLALGAGARGNLFAPGPRFGAVTADATALYVAIETVGEPIADKTFDPTAVKLRRFESGEWKPAIATQAKIEAGKLKLMVAAPEAGADYRLVYAPSPDAPLVDTKMRTVTPTPLVRQLHVQKVDGAWTVKDV